MNLHFYAEKACPHNNLIVFCTTSPSCHDYFQKSLMFRRQLGVTEVRVFPTISLQANKKNPDDCDKIFFNSTNFHRLNINLFKK